MCRKVCIISVAQKLKFEQKLSVNSQSNSLFSSSGSLYTIVYTFVGVYFVMFMYYYYLYTLDIEE